MQFRNPPWKRERQNATHKARQALRNGKKSEGCMYPTIWVRRVPGLGLLVGCAPGTRPEGKGGQPTVARGQGHSPARSPHIPTQRTCSVVAKNNNSSLTSGRRNRSQRKLKQRLQRCRKHMRERDYSKCEIPYLDAVMHKNDRHQKRPVEQLRRRCPHECMNASERHRDGIFRASCAALADRNLLAQGVSNRSPLPPASPLPAASSPPPVQYLR